MTVKTPAGRVLVADDEKLYCQMLKDFFSKRGFSVDTATDGRSAALLLEKSNYDLIFIDCNMPELSGVELARVLKDMPRQGRKVMISGYDLIDEDFLRNLDINFFLKKPFSFDEIKAIMAG